MARENRPQRCILQSRCSKPGSAWPPSTSTSRQQSFTHYIDNRRAWAARARIALEVPTHYCIARAENNSLEANEAQEFASFSAAISAIEHSHDVVVIDTPGADTYLMRLAHSMADTLVTPLNDSFLDFDVLATLDQTNFSVTGESHYAEMVREARRQRRLVDGQLTDWIVVRNRLSTLSSRNKRLVGDGINELSKRMGFRSVDGFAERVVYREFFPRGLTALDDLGRRDARYPSEHVACDRARGSDYAAQCAAPTALREW